MDFLSFSVRRLSCSFDPPSSFSRVWQGPFLNNFSWLEPTMQGRNIKVLFSCNAILTNMSMALPKDAARQTSINHQKYGHNLVFSRGLEVEKAVLLENHTFVPWQKLGCLTKTAKMTNLRSTHRNKGFAPQTPQNDENYANGGCQPSRSIVFQKNVFFFPNFLSLIFPFYYFKGEFCLIKENPRIYALVHWRWPAEWPNPCFAKKTLCGSSPENRKTTKPHTGVLNSRQW